MTTCENLNIKKVLMLKYRNYKMYIKINIKLKKNVYNKRYLKILLIYFKIRINTINI